LNCHLGHALCIAFNTRRDGDRPGVLATQKTPGRSRKLRNLRRLEFITLAAAD
jgi:hypothetical protein